jgi:cytochrome o ubiquinol oxidase subunit II
MSKKNKKSLRTIASIVCSVLAFAAIIALLMKGHTPGILAPAGTIAEQQRDLIVWTSLLSLVIVVPVFTMTFYIVWKYRVGNKKARYSPTMHSSTLAETIWWLVPLALIIGLAVVIWNTTHSLDPYKPITSSQKALTIQVVALDWKWLFLYPEENIATVNYVQIPVDRPVHFQITADAPMNSFWIPQLGGQIYAMAGMTTDLHLMANKAGTYRGVSANLSGEGFAGMKFDTVASSSSDYDVWVDDVRNGAASLASADYKLLAAPSQNNPVATYSFYEASLYHTILMKYMTPSSSHDAKPADKDHDAAHEVPDNGASPDAGNTKNTNMEHMHH